MFTDVNVTQVTKKKKNLTVNEVLDLFKSQGITDSAQVIRRWLREGKLKGIPPENRKAGWMIPQEEVDRFIAERNPLYAENQRLRAEIAKLHRKLEQLKAGERPSTIRSPLIWFGGKSRLAPEIIRRMPPHKVYVEPFGGAAHVLVQKPRAPHEVFNDIDGELVNFLLVARDQPERLKEACESLPYSRELYERWKREPWPKDSFERAVRFFYMNRSAISGGNAHRSTGWSHGTKQSKNKAASYLRACELIPALAQRMQGVMIEHNDFRKIIRTYDGPDTLFYVDPPYFGREHHYAGGFTEQDHRDLAEMLNRIRGKAIVSYYEHPLLDELYPGWRREKIDAIKQVGNTGSRKAEEVLLMNYDCQLSLFELA